MDKNKASDKELIKILLENMKFALDFDNPEQFIYFNKMLQKHLKVSQKW